MRKRKRVRLLRKRLGLTQAQLAQRLTVDRATISRWERGQQRPRRIYEQLMEAMNA